MLETLTGTINGGHLAVVVLASLIAWIRGGAQ